MQGKPPLRIRVCGRFHSENRLEGTLQRLQAEKEEYENNINEIHREMEELENWKEDPVDVIRDKAVNSISLVAGTKYNLVTITKKVGAVIATMIKRTSR